MKEIIIKQLGIVFAVVLVLSSCALKDEANSPIQADFFSAFDFSDGLQGWAGDFANYPEGYEDSLELNFDYAEYPSSSGLNGRTIRISGKNPYRDLFYFIKRKVDGLSPNAQYVIEYDIHFLVDIVEDLDDVAGDLYVKAGGLSTEPELFLGEAGGALDQKSQELNMDIGAKPSLTGQDVITIGRAEMPENRSSKLFNASSFGQQFIGTTNDQGEYWLIVGFDSSVSAHLAFYFSRINVFYTEI
jgi:hypothetical protein